MYSTNTYDSCTPTTNSNAVLFGERLKEIKEKRTRENADWVFGQAAALLFNSILFFEEICLNIFKCAKNNIIHEAKTKLCGFFW